MITRHTKCCANCVFWDLNSDDDPYACRTLESDLCYDWVSVDAFAYEEGVDDEGETRENDG